MSDGTAPIANLRGKVDDQHRLQVAGSLSVGGTTDGADFTPGASEVTPVGGYRDDAAPATVSEGKAAAARITEHRAIHVNLRDASGNEVAVGGGTQYDQGTAAGDDDSLTMAGAVRKDTPAAATGVADGDRSRLAVDDEGVLWTRLRQQLDADTGGGEAPTDVALLGLPGAGGPVAGGTATNPVRTDPTGTTTQPVSAASLPLPTGAATLAEQQSQTAVLGSTSGAAVVTDANGTIQQYLRGLVKLAITAGSFLVTATLAAGSAVIGKLAPPDTDVTGHTNYAKKFYTNAGAVTDGIIWSPAAGKRWHVVTLIINVSAACTVTLEDDKSGGDENVMKFEFAANSGVVIHFGSDYPWASGEDAADLLITTTAGNVYVTAVGYEV